jgi:hypothetical protein
MTKVVTITALFSELKGARCHQQGRGKGSTLGAAAGAAMRDLLKSKGLKRQRYTTFTATVSVGTTVEEKETNDQANPSQQNQG